MDSSGLKVGDWARSKWSTVGSADVFYRIDGIRPGASGKTIADVTVFPREEPTYFYRRDASFYADSLFRIVMDNEPQAVKESIMTWILSG